MAWPDAAAEIRCGFFFGQRCGKRLARSQASVAAAPLGWLVPLIIDAVAARSPPVDQRLQTSIAYNRLTVLLTSTPLVHEESAKLRNQISFHYRVPILHVR